MLGGNLNPKSHPVTTLRFYFRSSKSSFPVIICYQSLASLYPSITHSYLAHSQFIPPSINNRGLHTKTPFLFVTQNLSLLLISLLVHDSLKILCFETRFVFSLYMIDHAREWNPVTVITTGLHVWILFCKGKCYQSFR